MNREQRIRQLELKVFGDEPDGITWEDFLYAYPNVFPDEARKRAETDPDFILVDCPKRPDHDRVIRRFLRSMERRCALDADQQ